MCDGRGKRSEISLFPRFPISAFLLGGTRSVVSGDRVMSKNAGGLT